MKDLKNQPHKKCKEGSLAITKVLERVSKYMWFNNNSIYANNVIEVAESYE